MAARAIQDDSRRGKPEIRSRRPPPNRLQPPAHIYLSVPDGRGRHLPDRQNCRTSVEIIEKYYAAHITSGRKSTRFGPERVAGAAEVARGERQAQAAGGGSTLSSVFGSNGGCEPNTTLNICDHRLALSPPYHDNHRRLRVQTPTPIIAKRFLYIVASEHEK